MGGFAVAIPAVMSAAQSLQKTDNKEEDKSPAPAVVETEAYKPMDIGFMPTPGAGMGSGLSNEDEAAKKAALRNLIGS